MATLGHSPPTTPIMIEPPSASLQIAAVSDADATSGIDITKDIENQIIARARQLVTRELFTENAMFSSSDKSLRRSMVSKAISDATSEIVSVKVNPFVHKHHRKSIFDTLTTMRDKLIDSARSGATFGYGLLPPNGNARNESPVDYRVRIASELIGDHSQGLLFMHEYEITEQGQFICVGVLKHRFIVHLLVQWIWCSGLRHMLNKDAPEVQLKFAMAMAGAAAYCSLCEFSAPKCGTGQFPTSTHCVIFRRILEYIDNLDEHQRTELDVYFRFIISVGQSQVKVLGKYVPT